MYMIDIALTTEFAIHAGGERTGLWKEGPLAGLCRDGLKAEFWKIRPPVSDYGEPLGGRCD
jgi:hypothetical protein